MSWSYIGSPLDEDKDKVRFRIGDTNTQDQQMQDQEIDYLLTDQGSVEAAALKACEILAAKYSRFADSAVGDVKVSHSQKAAAYLTLAETLRGTTGITGAATAGPVVGGTDDDLKFGKDMMAPDGDGDDC